MAKLVTLTRHLPTGRDVVNNHLTVSKARMYAGMMLFDNRQASKAEAQAWAAELKDDGQRVEHPSGYAATIEKERSLAALLRDS